MVYFVVSIDVPICYNICLSKKTLCLPSSHRRCKFGSTALGPIYPTEIFSYSQFFKLANFFEIQLTEKFEIVMVLHSMAGMSTPTILIS